VRLTEKDINQLIQNSEEFYKAVMRSRAIKRRMEYLANEILQHTKEKLGLEKELGELERKIPKLASKALN